MGNSHSNFAERRLKNLSTDDELKIGFVPVLDIKADKPKANKPQPKYSNPYEEYIKTWEPGDVIPLVPPGKKMQFCTFNSNTLDVDTTFLQSTHRHASPTKFKSGKLDDIEYKVLGRKLKDSLESLLRRAANSRGLWVDDKNKLRCPPGTPAANQFTDITGSNCFIPSPRTAAQSGARAVRRTVNAAVQMSTPVGGRNETGFNAARATSEQIQELGFERVQELMAVGGRISPTSQAISGSMRIPSAFTVGKIPRPSTGVPKSKRKAPKGGTHPDSGHAVWQLGLREQIWRGRRATELARDTRERAQMYYRRADALRLPPNPVNPQGRPVGDISEKNQFVSVMSELFPNVPTSEIEEMFDQAIPQFLSRRDKKKLKEGLLQYWYSWIAEAIANPEQAKWVTTMQIDHKMGSAFEVQFDAFAPSPATGGRRITQAAANAAQKRGQNYQQGGLQLALKMNPFEMWKQMNRSGFDRNGRANGVADSVEGDMHYLATHEFGHLMHFASVMDTLGFQTQNLQRYQMARKLVAVQGGPPQWRRENYVNAWIVDFRQATNPTGNPSIQLLIDSAQRLSTRQYARTGTWGNVTGYTRQDLEEDLNNFHNALAEAIENNITDNADDQELMRQFAGGVYAASNNIEARAEYYAARRLFGDPALTGGQTGLPATVDTFADTMSRAQGATQTAAQIRKQLDDVGKATFNVSGNKWNITGRMAGSSLPQQPTLKTQAVRRAVDQDYPRRRRNQNNSSIVGRMQSGSQNDRTVGSRDWKNQDTLSSPNTNNPNTTVGKERPMIPMMLQSALGPNAVRDWKANPPRTDAERREWEEYINRVRFAAPADEPNTPISGKMSSAPKSPDTIPNRNPFEISGVDKSSDEGRELGINYTYALVGAGKPDLDGAVVSSPRNTVTRRRRAETYTIEQVDELLYRASTGDAAAKREYDELVKHGEQLVKLAERKIHDEQNRPITSIDAQIQGYPDIQTIFGGSKYREGGYTRQDISIDEMKFADLYAVHETPFDVEQDENGNFILKPHGDHTGSNRNTVHVGLNHRVLGHMERSGSKAKKAVIFNMNEFVELNPGSIDSLYGVDTILTPAVGRSLILPKSTQIITYDSDDNDARDRQVLEGLQKAGARFSFVGEGSTDRMSDNEVDEKIRQIAQARGLVTAHATRHPMYNHELRRARDSNGEPNVIGSEKGPLIARTAKPKTRGEFDEWTVTAEKIAKLSPNGRSRLFSKDMWAKRDFTPKPQNTQQSISGSMSTSRIKKNKQGVPQYPRTPTYGPMLGDAEQIFEGISSWDEFRKKYDDQEIVFLDYETTGLVFDTYGRALENGNPVEIGAIKVKNGQVIDRFNVFVNPGKPLQQWSKDNLRDADGNPLTDEYLQGMESLESGHRKLVEFAGPNAIMGVQNAAYDKNVLEDTLREAGIDWQAKGWIDLKDMAAMTLPRYSKENPDGPFRFDKEQQENVPSNGLADITKYLGVPLGKEHHRADKDAEATAESMRRLIDGAIQKNWSSDALSANKRKEYVKRTQDTFDSDVKEWESELSKYLGGGISGKMSSRSPALRATPEFGKRQTREYYSSLSGRTSWRPETLEQSEPARIQNRRAIIGRMKNFLNSGDEQMSPDYIGDRFGGPPEGSNTAMPMLEIMNGLDPSFGDYIRKTDEQELIADLRQAAIQFHAGIDPKPRMNTDTASLMEIMQNGLKRDDSSKPRRLSERMKAYEADIGISPDLPDGQRPVIGYVVHSDADFAHGEETFKEFSNKVDVNSPRYKFNLFDPKTTNNNNGFNSVFGDAEIILKPEVGERTAYGNGDALDNHVYPVLTNSTDSDEIGRALIDPHGRFDERDSHVVELLYGKFKNDFNAYRKDNGKTRPQINGVWSNRDALIAGGVNPDDIEEVRVPFRSLDTTNSTTAGEIAKKPRQLKYLPVTEYVDEEPEMMVASPPSPPSPPDDNDPNRMSKEELDKIQEKMKRSFAATKDEQKIIENILSGMRPMNAIPRDIAVRINDVDRFAKLTDDFKNLQKIEEAEKLQMLAKTRGIALSITNNFGLDIFDGRSFYRNSAKSKSSKEVLEKQIDKQIEELIETMRQEKFKSIKNISDTKQRLEKMQKEFDDLMKNMDNNK